MSEHIEITAEESGESRPKKASLRGLLPRSKEDGENKDE